MNARYTTRKNLNKRVTTGEFRRVTIRPDPCSAIPSISVYYLLSKPRAASFSLIIRHYVLELFNYVMSLFNNGIFGKKKKRKFLKREAIDFFYTNIFVVDTSGSKNK